jgi:DNA-binding CsgD family transcriptional regulator
VPQLTAWPTTILGFLEVSAGNHAEALDALAPILTAFEAGAATEIISACYIPDAVEAMVTLGRVDAAEPLVAALERNGAELDRPWMLAVGARCRAMVLAARGDVVAAERMAEQAMAAHDRLPMPFERARTQLFVGQLARRQRRKQVAARTLTDVVTEFRELGARLWADRARAELARVNGPRNRDSDLTPSETSVARHAAAGMTNRDIAAALFISPKTVEHNLSRVYRKLGVRSRAELARYSELIEG